MEVPFESPITVGWQAARSTRMLGLCALLWACGDVQAEQAPTPEDMPDQLSAWGLFEDAPAQVPADDVIPFDVTSPLYSDGSAKRRFMYIPDGETIAYSEDGDWQFPVGTVLVKTFSQPHVEGDPDAGERLLETRLLVRGQERWTPLTYVWNEAQDAAERVRIGALIDVSFEDADGQTRERTHVVPNTNECRDCHGTMERLDTLGGNTRMLNRPQPDGAPNQIDLLDELGLFDRTPEPAIARETLSAPFGDAPVEDRARAYMDSNCGSCHRPGRGEASQSGFYLDFAHTDSQDNPPVTWGVCKVPTSAGGATCGLTHDVVPGDPDRSILICRIESDNAKIMMPPLGRLLVDDQGVELLRTWIAGLPAADCQ